MRSHSLLRRQLKRFLGDAAVPPELSSLVDAVNDAYHEFDADRGMLERSLDLSSHELLQANSEMRALFQAIPDLFFRMDNEGTILDCKAGTPSDLFVISESLVGKRIHDISPKDVALALGGALERIRPTDVVTLPHPGGATRVARFSPAARSTGIEPTRGTGYNT